MNRKPNRRLLIKLVGPPNAVVLPNSSTRSHTTVLIFILTAFWFGAPHTHGQGHEFDFHDLTVLVEDSTGRGVQNALVRAYHTEWYLAWPDVGAARTGADGSLKLRLPNGRYTVVAAGGIPYDSAASGRALLLQQSVLVDADTQVILMPDKSSSVRFYERAGQPLDADALQAAPGNMMPNCWMTSIGMTRGGGCQLEFNGDRPPALFFMRSPTPAQEGYYVLFEDLPLEPVLELRMSARDLRPVRFEGDTNGKPGVIQWVLGFPHQDMAQRWWQTSFELTGAGTAWFSIDYFEYYPRVRLLDASGQNCVCFGYNFQGVDLAKDTNVLVRCGGPVRRQLRFAPPEIYLDVSDAYGNELWFSTPEGGGTPLLPGRFEVRDTADGTVLYDKPVAPNSLNFDLPAIRPTTAVFRLEWDLGPLDGLAVLEGGLHDPGFQWVDRVLNSSNFVVHAPAWHAAKADQLAMRLEQAYAAMSDLVGSQPVVTSERNFYVRPSGSVAGSQGQRLYYGGFFRWTPRSASDWESLSYHEIGHRMESEAFGCGAGAQPISTYEHNETVANLVSHYTLARVYGDAFAVQGWAGWANCFFSNLANPDQPPYPQWYNLLFIAEVYLPRRYGWETHRVFFRNWRPCSLGLSSVGYQEAERFAGLYSAICRTNLAWAWRLAGLDVSDSRVEDLRQRALVIETWPQPASVPPGEPASFAVGVIGGPCSVQWKKDGMALPGETNLVLRLPQVGPSKTGLYSVEIWNDIIHHELAPVGLSLSGPPVVLEESASSCAYEGEYVLLSVAAVGTEPLCYQWFQNQALLPLATNSLLVVRASSALSRSGYAVVVTNLQGAVTSRVATLEAMPGASTLLARYRLEDARNDPGVLESVSGRFAQFTAPTRWRSVPGVGGRALAFNGAGDMIRDSGPAVGRSDFSVSVWVRVDRFHQGGIVSQGGYCLEAGWLMDYGGAGQGAVRFWTSKAGAANGTMYTRVNALVPDGKWHHLVASVARNGTSQLYLDGVVTGAGLLAAGDLTNTNLVVGGLNNAVCGGVVALAGAVDEVQIYGKALSAAEVARLYADPGVIVQEPRPPRLSFALSGPIIVFAWDQTGYLLQENTELGESGSWVNVAGGSSSPAQVNIAPGQRFFRLSRQ